MEQEKQEGSSVWEMTDEKLMKIQKIGLRSFLPKHLCPKKDRKTLNLSCHLILCNFFNLNFKKSQFNGRE